LSARRTDHFVPLLQPPFSPHPSPTILFQAQAVIGCAPSDSLAIPSHRFFPKLNLHKARVRRKHGRLPPNGFIERARRSLPAFTTPPERASDKALPLSGINRAKLRRFVVRTNILLKKSPEQRPIAHSPIRKWTKHFCVVENVREPPSNQCGVVRLRMADRNCLNWLLVKFSVRPYEMRCKSS
jgi:hypothetical protein